jgi:hypothetical protein
MKFKFLTEYADHTPEAAEKAIRALSDSSLGACSVSSFSELFSYLAETKDTLANPDCCMCEGRGFYHALDVGEYDEQQTTVQCAFKRKQNSGTGEK